MKFLNWDIGSFDREVAIELYNEGINPLVSVFLASKGISSLHDARMMLGEISDEIYDPFLMKDIEKAVKRIHAAVESKERIAVYGDYDVDGMTSCAVLSLWLRAKGADFEIYIPHRIKEGYCLNKPALDALKSRGASLVITVDCGVTAIEEASYAKSIGLDLIITDHHKCRAELPEAFAIIDPKRDDCDYPNKNLAGVGVSFKLVCALEDNRPMGKGGHDLGHDSAYHENPDFIESCKKYSDLVAIGTVADVMSICGENRELIRRGLQVLNNAPRTGIKSLLLKSQSSPDRITSTTVSYTLAPRLNAAGRMGKAPLSLELLLTDDGSDADELADELCRLNNERRDCESSIFNEILVMVSDSDTTKPIVISKEGWHQGVTGIVASKLAERFRVPAIIISVDENGIGRGTCRSFGAFGIYQAISSCDDILID
jgi:single-stranded-DNA-specific exonuclease